MSDPVHREGERGTSSWADALVPLTLLHPTLTMSDSVSRTVFKPVSAYEFGLDTCKLIHAHLVIAPLLKGHMRSFWPRQFCSSLEEASADLEREAEPAELALFRDLLAEFRRLHPKLPISSGIDEGSEVAPEKGEMFDSVLLCRELVARAQRVFRNTPEVQVLVELGFAVGKCWAPVQQEVSPDLDSLLRCLRWLPEHWVHAIPRVHPLVGMSAKDGDGEEVLVQWAAQLDPPVEPPLGVIHKPLSPKLSGALYSLDQCIREGLKAAPSFPVSAVSEQGEPGDAAIVAQVEEVWSEEQVEDCPSQGEGKKVPSPAKPRLSAWAIGNEHQDVWHVFRNVRGSWRHTGTLKNVSAGRQADLLKAFAEGGGFLSKQDAIRLVRRFYPESEKDKIMGIIKPELSKLRKALRTAVGANGNDRNLDPLPWENEMNGWQATIQIGYAVQEDGEHVGSERRLRFKTWEALSDEEKIDQS